MENIKINKVLRKIYEFDYSKITLRSDDELIVEANGVSEFTQYFKKTDLDNGIIVTPNSYRSGLFYSSDNDGEIYSSNKYTPDIVTFGLNILGLKKGYFYRITILARDTGSSSLITSDRTLTVTDDTKQLVIGDDLKNIGINKECVGYIRATSNEANLFFTIGKIIIKNIVIDEVILAEEEKLSSEDVADEEIPSGKESLAAYGCFDLKSYTPELFKGKYVELTKVYGKGLVLYFDISNNTYCLERDNRLEILNEPFTNINYRVDFNFSKVKNYGIFDNYVITNVSTDISPNMLKQGYIEFGLLKDSAFVNYTEDGRLYISVYKLK